MSESGNGLYIVATPLGNLADISYRAIDVLGNVDLIAAEDTRHSSRLLAHYGISTSVLSLHEHNEEQRTQGLLQRMQSGDSVALISDAGTPLISDPGYRLVSAALEAGIRVIPIPGASAIIAALSVGGLATDRFVFEGFLPARRAGRREKLGRLVGETRTQVFFESCHRIVDCVSDMREIYGCNRMAVIARELTKTFETLRRDNLAELEVWLREDTNQQRGEFVLLVDGLKTVANDDDDMEIQRILKSLLKELPVKQAVRLAAEITGSKKNQLYTMALQLTADNHQGIDI